jgi:4-amino-4-deoxy-L-arabinose transferase-like glycosyltransferase
MNPSETRVALNTGLTILGLVGLRLIAAAFTPITFDEAYYWTWSKHLAGGYYDHPPMVAVVIRLGTLIAGDSEFGVRLFSILLALPMSWAIYQAAAILFGSRRVAASSAILLNITLMAAVGTMIVTPDAPLLVASSFLLFALAKVLQTGHGVWWLAVGAAAGCALLSKYTALFFGPAILIWLVAVPKLRHWLISPWLYLGGLVALLLFAPVILWNAEHHWVSFIKQMGRARIEDFRPVFIAELIPTQIAFATRPRSSIRCSGSSSPISSGTRCMPASKPIGLGRSIRRLRSPPPSPRIWSNGSLAGSAWSISAGVGWCRAVS